MRSERKAMDTGGRTVLVVDDSAFDREILMALLEAQGHTVHLAHNADTAWLQASVVQPDLILLDVYMPGTDGFGVCEGLKSQAETRDIPVIFISAADDGAAKVQAFNSGGVDYITKPFYSEEVLARVSNHLAFHDLQRRLEERVRERSADLAAANLRLQKLTTHREAVREEERKRIAGELHDELGSSLTALKMDLSLLAMELGCTGDAQCRLGQMRELLEHTIGTVRQVATSLRPSVLNLGLVPALEWLVQDFERRTGVACTLTADSEVGLDDALATAIFRIVQESLTNVVRHAEARRVDIVLACSRGVLELSVRDDGRGFDPAAVGSSSFGLLNIRERVCMLGGEAVVESRPGEGCRVGIRIPLPD